MLGALGQREDESGAVTRTLSSAERPIVKRQALGVMAKSAIIAIIAGLLLYFV